VRPWTATGLGIFESTRTDQDGSFIITGGHNTGGFAQAPAVAMAVLASLERRSHLMHTLYHPNRLEMASVREAPAARK
jgi:D-amino-acid dehydrogenase